MSSASRSAGVPCLIRYASKTLPSACRNYSVTGLEMTGMLINLHTWRGFTYKAEIDLAVDHKAVVQIMKAKHPPVSPRVEVLLEKMLSDPFNLYYVKGKDLILADFLSCIRSDRSDPNEVIPISFADMKARFGHPALCFHGCVTRSTAKREGLVMLTIHGSDKLLDPHRKPEHQTDLTPRSIPSAPPTQVQRPFKWTVIPPSATQVASRKLIDQNTAWQERSQTTSTISNSLETASDGPIDP